MISVYSKRARCSDPMKPSIASKGNRRVPSMRPDSPLLSTSHDRDRTDQETAVSSANTAKIMSAFFAGQGLLPDIATQERRAAKDQPRHTSHASTPPPEVRRKLHLDTSAMQDNISALQPEVEVVKPPPKRTFGQLPVAQGPPWHRSLFLEQWKPCSPSQNGEHLPLTVHCWQPTERTASWLRLSSQETNCCSLLF